MTIENPPRNKENEEDVLNAEVETFENDNELSPVATKESKVEEIFERSSEIGRMSDKDKDRIAELKSQIVFDNPDHLIQKALASKDDGTENFTDTRSDNEKQQPAKKVTGLKKLGLALGFIFAGLTGQASNGAEKNTTDSTKEKGISLENARKVKEISPDYTIVKKDEKTYGYKTSSTNQPTLEMAKESGDKSETEEYKNWIIQQLEKGISPDELVAKKYISPDKEGEYAQYYKKPSVDVVYMENSKKEVDPFAAFAKMGEPVYGPNKHIAAEMFFSTRKTGDIQDAGVLNTQKSDVLIRFRNDFGFTGEYIIVPADKAPHLNTFQSEKDLLELKKIARHENKKGDSDISATDLAKNNSGY